MKASFVLLATILATSARLFGSATPDIIDRPEANAGPTQVSVGIWVVDVTSIDSAQQTFSADIVVGLRWRDTRLAHRSSGVAHYNLEQIWHPRVGVVNETNQVSHRMPESVDVEGDGSVIYRQRYAGSFTQPLRLRSFPFDRQTFRVQLVAVRYQSNEVVFGPDENWIHEGLPNAAGISESITLPDWEVEQWQVKPLGYKMAPGLEYSGYAFEFTASRNVWHYLLKVILPLVLIVIMSWAVFWMDPIHTSSQISIAITSMLTLIAYRFAVDSPLPRLPYMTRLDAFILMSTLLIFFSLIEVLITTVLETNQHKARAKKIDRSCRIIFPAIFILASILTFLPAHG